MPSSVHTEANAVVVGVLIDARHNAGLKQDELAVLLGKPQSFVSRIETGQRRVDLLEFFAIARALKAEPRELFERIAERLESLNSFKL